MGIPAFNRPSGGIVRDGIYIIAALKADPKCKDLIGVLEPDQIKVKASMATRVEADTAAIETGAAFNAREDDLREVVINLGTRALGHYLKRTHDGYLRLYPVAPSAVGQGTIEQRTKAYETLRKSALSKETPKELHTSVQEVVAAHDAWLAARKHDVAATEAFGGALSAEDKACDSWHTAVRKLRGQLIDRHPRSPKRVARYFPKKSSAAGRAKVAKVKDGEGKGEGDKKPEP